MLINAKNTDWSILQAKSLKNVASLYIHVLGMSNIIYSQSDYCVLIKQNE